MKHFWCFFCIFYLGLWLFLVFLFASRGGPPHLDRGLEGGMPVSFLPQGIPRLLVLIPVAVVAVIALVVILWLAFGRGPRRWRAFKRIQKALHEGDWKNALDEIDRLGAEAGLSPTWQGRLRNARGEGLGLAADDALRERQFEKALEYSLEAAPLLGVSESEQRARVVESMLAEVRRVFAAGPDQNDGVLALCRRIFAVQPVSAEAFFWQALAHIRRGELDQALAHLTTSHEEANSSSGARGEEASKMPQGGKGTRGGLSPRSGVVDPPLYLGILLHRLGRPQEALRHLAEANRIGSSCPFVTWQMGISLVASGGDSRIALSALQRALGPRGLGLWKSTPTRVWIEAFPEPRSYVRKLANKHPFTCPLLGNDLSVIIRQGELALAQAYYRQEQFQESATLFNKLLQESPPTLTLVRGLGLAQARLGRYDQAFKHLRAALEEENPKNPITAGYLALCGALGRPTNPEDKPKNIRWACSLLARYPLTENAEWAHLISTVHQEARSLQVPLAREDQVLACDALASVHATDPYAASAYSHLAASFPDAVQPRYAWLYAQAAVEHQISTDQDLPLFARTFQTAGTAKESGPARTYFLQQGWDFEMLEYTYLERCALQAPGSFPEVLGPDYPQRGLAFLLERSQAEEQKGDLEQAREAVEVLLKLAPHRWEAHDRLACLLYRDRSDLPRAMELLGQAHTLDPHNPWPLIRRAVLAQEQGQTNECSDSIRQALERTRGKRRAAVAFLGAQLALRQLTAEWDKGAPREEENATPFSFPSSPVLPFTLSSEQNGDSTPGNSSPLLVGARSFLETCLEEDPVHQDALWILAALHGIEGDLPALVRLTQRMAGLANPPESLRSPLEQGTSEGDPTGGQGETRKDADAERVQVRDPRFFFLAAVGHLAGGDYSRVLALTQHAIRLAQGTRLGAQLTAESYFLEGWAHLRLGDREKARQALQRVVPVTQIPSLTHARALLGQVHFERGVYDEAIKWWTATDANKRADWQFDETLRQTVLLSGLLALQDGRYEQAAERFREAGRLGLRDRRLGSWIFLALVKAGQRLLYST